MTTASAPPECDIDLERLFVLRLVLARYGEMDGARWWNTNGLLGRSGALLLGRGLPRTHHFAQARAVFAVARARCRELFHLPGSVTLWELPVEVEDLFDAQLQAWLEDREEWSGLFERLQQLPSDDLLTSLSSFELLEADQAEAVSRLRRSAEGRAVALGRVHALDDETITLLCAAFARGEPGKPAVPYVLLEAS